MPTALSSPHAASSSTEGEDRALGEAGWDKAFGPFNLKTSEAKFARLLQHGHYAKTLTPPPPPPAASWAAGWGMHVDGPVRHRGVDVVPIATRTTDQEHLTRRAWHAHSAAKQRTRLSARAQAAKRPVQQVLRSTAGQTARPRRRSVRDRGSSGSSGSALRRRVQVSWMTSALTRVLEGRKDMEGDADLGAHGVRAERLRKAEALHVSVGGQMRRKGGRVLVQGGALREGDAGAGLARRGRATEEIVKAKRAEEEIARHGSAAGAARVGALRGILPIDPAVRPRKAPIAKVASDIAKSLGIDGVGSQQKAAEEGDDEWDDGDEDDWDEAGAGSGGEDDTNWDVADSERNADEEVREFETDVKNAFDPTKITFATIPLHHWAWWVATLFVMLTCIVSGQLIWYWPLTPHPSPAHPSNNTLSPLPPHPQTLCGAFRVHTPTRYLPTPLHPQPTPPDSNPLPDASRHLKTPTQHLPDTYKGAPGQL